MINSDNIFIAIQETMNAGESEKAMQMIEPLLSEDNINNISILYADVLRSTERYKEAAEKYKECAKNGGSKAALLWRRACECYVEEKDVDTAVVCIRKSLALNPTDFYSHQLIASLLFTSTLYPQAISHAHILLKHAGDDLHLSIAENIFRFALLPFEAYQVVKRRAEVSPNPEYFLGLLVCAAQGILYWDEGKAYEKQLEEKYYSQGDYSSVREIPLYNIARTMDEHCNFECAKAATKELNEIEPAYDHSTREKNSKIRIGMLSADFASHPVIQLIIGFCEQLDKDKFEIYAYDDGKNVHHQETRFSACVTKHIDVREQSDKYVADKVYEDNIDILIDLMGITTKNRLGVLALRPSLVTASFLGFPGTTGLSSVDYIITDKIITPDSSKAYFAEHLCRLPEVFMPCDNKRSIAANPVSRKAVGLPEDEDTIIFCSFNRSFKLDQESVYLWMRILARVPNSVLWQKADEQHMKDALEEAAILHGVDPNRIIYAGNTSSGGLHIARTSMADIALDTLIYNGHTITTDILWANVPVITVRGKHFASRVSSSLLTAIGLEELICPDVQAMEDLAVELANDRIKLKNIKEKLKHNICTEPLFNTARYTLHFEKAMEMMLERADKGLPADCLDVPCLPQDKKNFLPCGLPMSHEKMAGIPEKGDYADMAESQHLQKSPYTIHYGTCPICDSTPPQVGLPVRIDKSEKWTEPLPTTSFWVTCDKCFHINTNAFWNHEAFSALYDKNQKAPINLEEYAAVRKSYLPIIERAWELIPHSEEKKPVWLEAYAQDSAPAFMANERGFNCNILSLYTGIVDHLNQLGISAWHNDFLSSDFTGDASVILYSHCIDTVPYPKMLLERAYDILNTEGILIVSFVNRHSSIWHLFGENEHNIHIQNPFKLHVFSQTHMETLLQNAGFKIVDVKCDPQIAGSVILFAQKK